MEIARIAELIELPTLTVESKLSQMILDGKFEGILDQGSGCLVVFDEQPPETMYKATLETIGNMTRSRREASNEKRGDYFRTINKQYVFHSSVYKYIVKAFAI